jgi:hypothetical protein
LAKREWWDTYSHLKVKEEKAVIPMISYGSSINEKQLKMYPKDYSKLEIMSSEFSVKTEMKDHLGGEKA